MKKCPKTWSEKHKFEDGYFQSEGFEDEYTGSFYRTVRKDFIRAKICIYCGLIDDRPTGKVGKGKK